MIVAIKYNYLTIQTRDQIYFYNFYLEHTHST